MSSHSIFSKLLGVAICTIVICFFAVVAVHSQSESLRRLTITPGHSTNINPSLSGDGRRVAFESNADLASVGGAASFRLVRANVDGANPSFAQLAPTRGAAPALSQDGSRIAFSVADNPLNLNRDGNSEIFYFDGSSLRQLTDTLPGDGSERTTHGNFQPSISDDGRFVAFASNRNLVGSNADSNFEVFIYDAATQSFQQITSTFGIVGASAIKISGDASRIVYVNDSSVPGAATTTTTTAAAAGRRDLVLHDRSTDSKRVIASSILNLALTPGRAISDDGTRIVYSANTNSNASEVFLFDERRSDAARQLTTLGARADDVPLHATISGNGSRISFATQRTVIGSNTDRSVELYSYDVPTNQFARITNVTARIAHEIVSSLSDDGSTIAFNYSRSLSGAPSTSDTIDDSEIYIRQLNPVLSLAADLKIRNLAAPVSASASSTTTPAAAAAIAPDSLAVATAASNLARSTRQAVRLPDDTFPLELEGATVTVNNRLAQILFISPTEIHFHVPAWIEIGEATIVVNNGDGFETRGTITVAPAAPGIFAAGADGRGAGIILDADTLQTAPFDLSSTPDDGSSRRLILFATGARRAAEITITVANRVIKASRIVDSPDFPGLDQIHFSLPANSVGAGTHSLAVSADNRRSNSVTLTLTGTAPSDIKRIEILPINSTLELGRTVQLKALAFDSKDQLVPETMFQWASSNTAVAEVSDSGLATARGIGATTITASAGSIRSTSVPLTVARPSSPVTNPTAPAVPIIPSVSVATYVEIAQLSSALTVGESRQLTARIFDQTGRRITPAMFVWSSSDANTATINENGLVTTLRAGVVTITATNRNVTGSLTLTISKPQVVINELLFDPADGAAGDANYDGVRNGTEDEFIELVNDSDTAVDIAGWTLRTRGANSATEITRHTFTSSAMIPMRSAVVIFGGGNFNSANPIFGLAQIVKASSGGLLLANTSLTVLLRDATGNLKAELSYGAGTDTPGGSSVNASLTRSPDVTGEFVAHTSLDPVNTRRFSPGTRIDGTPHGSPPITRIELSPASTEVVAGAHQLFRARAFASASGIEVEVPNVSFTWESSDPKVASISAVTAASVTAKSALPGTATIRARAGGQLATAPLKVNPVVASINLNPETSIVVVGDSIVFTATARDANGATISGSSFAFALGDSTPANAAVIVSTTANTVTVRGAVSGLITIVAKHTRAHDGTSLETSSRLTINPAPPRVTRVEVTPTSRIINRGATQQFTAQAFDASNQVVTNAMFTWTSSDLTAATVEASGLARGTGLGSTTITAATSDGRGSTTSGTATLAVQVPLVINEILADPRTADGDANRDGVVNSDNDEFIEVVNASSASLDISGITIFETSTMSPRFTFPNNIVLTANQAAVVFGGGTPPRSDSAFGGAQIFTTTTLDLGNGGDTITLKLNSTVIAGQSYGSEGGDDQSLTRSPDLTGAFAKHSNNTTTPGGDGRRFSPGTGLDGAPFDQPTITRIEVAPTSATIYVGGTQAFTARAFSNANGAEIENPNVSFVWTSSDPSKASVQPATGSSTVVSGIAAGSTTITARAGGRSGAASLIVEPVVASIDLTPETADVVVGSTQAFTATARDANGNVISGISFTFNLRNASPIDSATIANTSATTVTVRGDNIGSATIVASYTRPNDNSVIEDASSLIVSAPAAPPRIPIAGEVVINEALVSFAASTAAPPQPRPDFVELFNKTNQILDISGLIITFRATSGSAATVTLPGAMGSNTTLIEPSGYFLVVNGAETFGVASDFNASAAGLDLHSTTGGIKIEINTTKLDGLAYKPDGSTVFPPAFAQFGEGAIFMLNSTSNNRDLIRSPNGVDANDNVIDFRRNGTATSVTPKKSNP